jgi:hypothetical protein
VVMYASSRSTGIASTRRMWRHARLRKASPIDRPDEAGLQPRADAEYHAVPCFVLRSVQVLNHWNSGRDERRKAVIDVRT